MKTMKKSSRPNAVLSQSQNNSTTWVGHLKNDPTDHFAGQTFNCPSEGQMDNIQLYTSAVEYSGEVVMTLHEFDTRTKNWGPAIGSSAVEVEEGDVGQWIHFALPPVEMQKNVTYGFRVQTQKAMIGLGEAATGAQHPFTFGREWSGDAKNEKGLYYSYFSLAFKVELSANN